MIDDFVDDHDQVNSFAHKRGDKAKYQMWRTVRVRETEPMIHRLEHPEVSAEKSGEISPEQPLGKTQKII
jgi:hypothetical protein